MTSLLQSPVIFFGVVASDMMMMMMIIIIILLCTHLFGIAAFSSKIITPYPIEPLSCGSLRYAIDARKLRKSYY